MPSPHPFRKNHSGTHPAVRAKRRVQEQSFISKRTGPRTVEPDRPYLPPEDWYEPRDEQGDPQAATYRIVTQQPGAGYRHVVSEAEIRDRLAQLPDRLVAPLQVVQLSRMTKKKRSFPCYGMQWGNAVYLYPLEESLIEYFGRPPRPPEWNEARMFGGRWEQQAGGGGWMLIWTEATIRDFYLNNVLIHELGHVLDERNSSYTDRERYAEWFAIEYGYKPSRRRDLAHKAAAKVTRRHHSV